MWVTNAAGDSVTEIGWRPGSHPIVRSGPGYGFLKPGAITAGHDRLWVADDVAHAIFELNASDGSLVRKITKVAAPGSLLLFGNRLWVTNPAANTIYLINTRTGSKVRAFRHIGLRYPSALAVSHRLLWVANEAKDTVTVMSATTGAWKATLRGSRFGLSQPVAEVAGRTMLWVASTPRTITQINTVSRKPVRIISGSRFRLGVPGPMALADGKLWVLNTAGNSVTEIDAATGRLVAVFAGRAYGFDHPVGIAAHNHAIWIASASSLTRLVPPASRSRAMP